MAEQTTKIIGVDYSGNETDNATWVAKGTLKGSTLEIESCCRLGKQRKNAHQLLEDELRGLSPGAVAAMDFPFSVPSPFIEHWRKSDDKLCSPTTMPELWEAANRLQKSNTQLKKWCKEFVADRTGSEHFPEPKRKSDEYNPGSFSPFHRVSPDMVPMTFRGMQMLHQLWKNGNCQVPPLDCAGRNGPLLLEIMPGTVLSAMGLPHQKYKGRGASFRKLREDIWYNLEPRSGITISANDKEKLKSKATDNHDCLDAVVAAVAAALWHIDRDIFHGPPPKSCKSAIEIEGWLYSPCPSKLPI